MPFVEVAVAERDDGAMQLTLVAKEFSFFACDRQLITGVPCMESCRASWLGKATDEAIR